MMCNKNAFRSYVPLPIYPGATVRLEQLLGQQPSHGSDRYGAYLIISIYSHPEREKYVLELRDKLMALDSSGILTETSVVVPRLVSRVRVAEKTRQLFRIK